MKILMAHDGSSYSEKALERAAGIVANTGAELTIVSVAPDLCLPSAELSMEQCDIMAQAFARDIQGIQDKAREYLAGRGMTAETVVQNGRVVDRILETAESIGADLIVLGSQGRHGASRFFLGSVSGKVADLSKCDVLIVK